MEIFDVEEIFNTDEESTSNSSDQDKGVFGSDQVVFEYQEVKKDTAKIKKFSAEGKIKKKKKKRSLPVKTTGSSSSMLSEPPTVSVKEEFFDARDSYHFVHKNNEIRPIIPVARHNDPEEIDDSKSFDVKNKNPEENRTNTSQAKPLPPNPLTSPYVPEKQ